MANARYVAQHTDADEAEIVLLRTTIDPTRVASAAQVVVAALPGLKITDMHEAY